MQETRPLNTISEKRVIIKGFLLFLLINLLFAAINPSPSLGKVSAYNFIFPGRVRLPYGEKPDEAYNLSLYNLEAMFASHELAAGNKPHGEYRVLLIGDSSVWGYLLEPEQTLTAFINAANIQTGDGRTVRAYNLGYPTLSLAKDVLILSSAMRFGPDLIVWLVTLESFPNYKQIESPIVQNNPSMVKALINDYTLNLNANDSRFVESNFFNSTIIGQRRSLADLLRLQFYGVMWAATGIDQYYPESYEPPQENLDDDKSFHGFLPREFDNRDLSFDILLTGARIAGNVPIIFVNEPIYISRGSHSDIRYNFFYPRWVYDRYRHEFAKLCKLHGWTCLDEWDLVSPIQFTNSAIHMTPSGTHLLAVQIEGAIRSIQIP